MRKKPYIEVYCRILHAYTIIYANIHQRVLFCTIFARSMTIHDIAFAELWAFLVGGR